MIEFDLIYYEIIIFQGAEAFSRGDIWLLWLLDGAIDRCDGRQQGTSVVIATILKKRGKFSSQSALLRKFWVMGREQYMSY